MSETDKAPEVQQKVFHKRKKLNLKVKQDFQLWLLTRIMMTALFAILLATVLIYLYARGVVDTEFLGFKPDVRKVSEVMLPILLATALTSTIAGLLLALFLPQKIAGPIFRVEQDLMVIRTGDLTKAVNLRCADILKELAETINMTVADISYMVQDVKKSGRKLELKINEGDTGAIKEALEYHLEQVERIKTNP